MFSNSNDPNSLPTQTAFSQQRIDAWRPLITPKIAASMMYLLSAVFAICGGVCYSIMDKSSEIAIRYDNLNNDTVKKIDFTIEKEFKHNQWIFYKLTNFYQTHSRYITSISYPMLRGVYVPYEEVAKEIHKNFLGEDEKNMKLPCGAIALSVFNDTFSLSSGQKKYTLNSAGISWRSDKEKLFKNLSSQYAEGDKWLQNNKIFPLGQRDEHFIVWMRSSSLPTFYKPYASIREKLSPGNYTITIEDNYNVDSFGGKKYVVIADIAPFGGRNVIISYFYFIFAGIMMIAGSIVLATTCFCPRKLGDTSYIKFE